MLFSLFLASSIFLYVVAASLVSINRFWQVDAFWYELGLYDSAIYKVAHFKAPIIEQFGPPAGKWIFADHFNPSLFLYSPLYWFTDKTEAILIAQAVTVGLSAWMAYLMIRKITQNKLVILAIMFSFLGFIGIQNALYTDFHDTTVATFFVMVVFWAIFTKRWLLYWIFLVITLGFKETMPGLGVGIGLYLILRKERQYLLGFLTILLSLTWYFTVTKWVIPAFSGSNFGYPPTIPPSIKDFILSFFVPAELKLRTIFLTFLTFGFAPLFSLATLPVIVEHFAERFVFSQAATRWDLGLHYNALLSPLFFVGAIPFVVWLSKKNRLLLNVWAAMTIMTVIFLHRFYLHGPLLLATDPIFYGQTERNKFVRNFAEKIPRDGLIMTQNNLAAHLSHASVTLINHKEFVRINPDVVALDIREGQNPNNFFPATLDDAKKLADLLETDPKYQKTEKAKDQLIFVRND